MKSAARPARARSAAVRDAEIPTGIAAGMGAVVVVAAGLIAATVPASLPAWRLVVMAVAVAVVAAVSLNARATAVLALIAFLIVNGFLEDEFGELSWHGLADLWRAVALAAAGGFGLAAGWCCRYRPARAVADGDRERSREKEGEHGA